MCWFQHPVDASVKPVRLAGTDITEHLEVLQVVTPGAHVIGLLRAGSPNPDW